MYVYVACVPECCGSICYASQLRWEAELGREIREN
jgi:hypothetical protein